jgi:hypothetical protein
MKKTLLITIVLASGLFACAKNPPKTVSDNFAKKFTTATNVKWDQEEANEWEAEFKMDGKEMSASFDNAGKWITTEAVLLEMDLPAVALNAVKTAYEGWDIKVVESIETPEYKGYELGLKKGGKKMEIQVTPDGKIKENKESKEEDEEDEK